VDLSALEPRVRRAIEGPKSPVPNTDPNYLAPNQVEALAADAVADIILLTTGRWPHVLVRTGTAPDESWSVEPDLSEPEERLVAAQAALSFFFFVFQDLKTVESIQSEGQTYEVQRSAQAMVRQIDAIKSMRDDALAALLATEPVLARYASLIAQRDREHYALIETWRMGQPDVLTGPTGGQLIYP
jgi:hypothetical protein